MKTEQRMKILKLMLVALFFGMPLLSYADDLSYLYGYGGRNASENSVHASMWQVDYRHYFNDYLALAVAYVNEGHFFYHKRDGVAPQIWLNLPLFDNHLALALGGGLYRYYDTVIDSGCSKNEQGWGQIYSASGTYNFSAPFFVRVMANEIVMPKATYSVLFGVGIRLWDKASEVNQRWLSFYQPLSDDPTKNEVTAFFGKTVHNSSENLSGVSFGLEYRRNIWKYLDWTATWLYQDDSGALERNGVGTQVWAVHDYWDRHLTLGLGAGIYYFSDAERNTEYQKSNHNDNLGEMVSAMIRYRINDKWSAKFIWNRIGTSYNHDTDDFLVGVGYSW